jgi:hypothetical protein
MFDVHLLFFQLTPSKRQNPDPEPAEGSSQTNHHDDILIFVIPEKAGIHLQF